MMNIFTGLVLWAAAAVLAPASEAKDKNAKDQGVCVTYTVVKSEFVDGARTSRQYKVSWSKSTGGGRITFHKYPKFAGETESINSKTGEACKP